MNIEFSPEVQKGREAGRAIVALESVIVAHGLPSPANLETAVHCEDIVRRAGCVPATLALREGVVRAGLLPEEIERLARELKSVKANLSNMAAVLASGGWGATTVGASVWICHRAGISVLVTGGIGGVHRGFAESFDISSDLTALSRFPVLVAAAGVKSLLDVGATRERLETLGIPILGWRTDTFPRFYIRESRYSVDARVETADEVARIARVHWAAGGAGILLAIPCPKAQSLKEREVEEALARAEAERKQAAKPVEGRDVTPFLLDRLHHHTQNRSIEANIALITHNAEVGSRVARALSREAK